MQNALKSRIAPSAENAAPAAAATRRHNRVRPVEPRDIDGIIRLTGAVGFPQRSLEGWKWVMFENTHQGEHVSGWVIEDGGQIIAFLGLHISRLLTPSGPVDVASGHTFICLPEHKGVGSSLLRRVARYPHAAAIISLSSNHIVAPNYPRVGIEPWLGAKGRERTEWPLHWHRYLAGKTLQLVSRLPHGFAMLAAHERFGAPPAPLVPTGNDAIIALDPFDPVHGAWLNALNDAASGIRPDRSAQGKTATNELIACARRSARKAGDSALRQRLSAFRSPAERRGTGPRLRLRSHHDTCHVSRVRLSPELAAWHPDLLDGDLFFSLRNRPADS